MDKLLAELHPPDRVAHLVERRGEERYSHDVGNDQHDGARDARLAGKPHLEGELTCSMM